MRPPTSDSLDAIELTMAIEEGLGRSLSEEEIAQLTPEIAERIANGELGDDDLDDAIAILVRKPGPRGPRGQAGAAAVPEERFVE